MAFAFEPNNRRYDGFSVHIRGRLPTVANPEPQARAPTPANVARRYAFASRIPMQPHLAFGKLTPTEDRASKSSIGGGSSNFSTGPEAWASVCAGLAIATASANPCANNRITQPHSKLRVEQHGRA